MKKALIVILLIFTIQFILSCISSVPYVHFEENYYEDSLRVKYAVLNFEHSGQFLSAKTAMKAADQFSAELYIKKNIQVIERSLVRDALKKYKSSGRGKLAKEEINKIASELNADFLILGALNSIGAIEQYYDSGKVKVELTIRIINSTNGDVVGMVKHEKEGSGDIEELVNRMIKDIIYYFDRN